MNFSSLFAQNSFSDVVSLYSSDISSLDTLDPGQIMAVAASYFKLERYQEAVDFCSRFFVHVYEREDFHALYAAALRRSGAIDLSEKSFLVALNKFPNSLPIKNNYANLLIDKGSYDTASSVLQEVLTLDPSYHDALVNMSRLESFIKSKQDTANSNSTLIRPNSINLISSNLIQLDPLLAAFSEDEVNSFNRDCPSTNSQASDSFDSLLRDFTTQFNTKAPSSFRDLLLLASDLSSVDPKLSLEYCNFILAKRGLSSEVFLVAASSYLSLKAFNDAEVNFLLALNLGANNPLVYANLSSLTLMRGNVILASYFCDQLKQHFPAYDKLDALLTQIKSTPNSSEIPLFQFESLSSEIGDFSSTPN